MKTDKRIFLYLDNQMSALEKSEFEKELNNSILLKEKFDEVKESFEALKKLDDFNKKSIYFNNLTARFREKNSTLAANKNFQKYGIAFSSLIVVFFTFTILFHLMSVDEKIIVQTTSNEIAEINSAIDIFIPEKIPLANYEFTEEDENLLNQKLYEELELTDQKASKSMFNNAKDINKLIADLSDEEIEIIYSELSNKKIL